MSEGKNACISMDAYKPYARDYILECLPNVKIIQIHVDMELLVPKNAIRMERAYK
jgi:hypothetical protein